MIPAILGLPMVQGVVGSVVGGVMNAFSPSAPSTPPVFGPYMDRASQPAAPSPATQSSGTLQASQLNQMNPTDIQTWANSLAGKHVDATDASGRTISGLVSGMQMLGHTMALNVSGHLVTVSQLKQVSWSPANV